MHSLWETMLGRWLEAGSAEPVWGNAGFAGLAAGNAPAAAPAIAVRREPAARAPTKPAAAAPTAVPLRPGRRRAAPAG